MKRKWTRGEKWLWATPLIFLVAAGVAVWGPQVARRQLGWPTRLETTPESRIATIALADDGSVLAATTGESYAPKADGGKLYLWDAHSLKPTAPWRGNPASKLINAPAFRSEKIGLAISPDAKFIGYAPINLMNKGNNATYHLFETATGNVRWKISGKYLFTHVHFSPDGQQIGIEETTKSGVEYQIRRVSDGVVVSRWISKGASVFDADFVWASDGKTIVCRSQIPDPLPIPDTGDGFAKWLAARQYTFDTRRVSDGQLLKTWNSPPVLEFDISPDGRFIAFTTGTRNRNTGFNKVHLMMVDSATGHQQWDAGTDLPHPTAVRFSPDGNNIAVMLSGMQATIALLDARTRKNQRTLKMKDSSRSGSFSTELAWAPDGKRLFAIGDSAVLVWDLE